MLARENRIVSPADFRRAMRKGRRLSTGHTVVHITSNNDSETRFGFIVSKVTGNAVARNLVKRRLREIAADSINEFPKGTDVVIRVLAGAETLSMAELTAEVASAIAKGIRKLK